MTLQEHYLSLALREKNIVYNQLFCDHVTARNNVDGKLYPLIFPYSLLKLCENLKCEKTIDYFFRGVITDHRKWINQFKGEITHSNRGRGDYKYTFDIEYYKCLNSAKFALCPVGDYDWSYRMFEAVMCDCIPIAEQKDIFFNEFICYNPDEKHIYDIEIVNENRKRLKKFFL